MHTFIKSKNEEFQKSISDSFYLRLYDSWSIRMNVTHCLVDLIDDHKNIIDYDTISLADPKTIWLAQNPDFFQDKNILHWVTSDGKFLCPSTLMEDFLVVFTMVIQRQRKTKFVELENT